MDTVAVTVRGTTVAPICDFSSWYLIVMPTGREKKTFAKLHVARLTPEEKKIVLLRAGVQTVICGCISDSFRQRLEHSGLRVIWGIAGPVAKVLEVFQSSRLDHSPYRVLKQGPILPPVAFGWHS